MDTKQQQNTQFRFLLLAWPPQLEDSDQRYRHLRGLSISCFDVNGYLSVWTVIYPCERLFIRVNGYLSVWMVIYPCERLFIRVNGYLSVWTVSYPCERLFIRVNGYLSVWTVIYRCERLFIRVNGYLSDIVPLVLCDIGCSIWLEIFREFYPSVICQIIYREITKKAVKYKR